jgi:homogentisate 1,2-dioxygenase
MTPHGPDTATFERAIEPDASEAPGHLPPDTLAFMCAPAFSLSLYR